mgnify:CR=1 FL=1
MTERIRGSYNATIAASYLGYITQAIVNNFAPLLFLILARDFSLSLAQITVITTLNFAVQLLVDLLSARVVDRIGYRRCIVAAHVLAAAGLIGMAVLPRIMPPYAGLLTSVVLYAIGGGITEVLISPIVEACPTRRKEAAMSLLHSFYCWGHVGLVLLTTAFLAAFGEHTWPILTCLWALIPLGNMVLFTQVPLADINEGREPLSLCRLLGQGTFWLLLGLMVCAGASEQAMSQWASAFAESSLHISKTMGDLAGPCVFAALMGLSRALYGKFAHKIPLRGFMLGSSVLCILCYLAAMQTGSPVLSMVGCALCGFSVGIFWPGTFSMAALALPGGGTAMYALMALAGDLGCSAGPTVVGLVADASQGRLQAGLGASVLFPAMMLTGILLISRRKTKQ